MDNVICHICLHTDIIAVKLSTELTDFVDELCDYQIIHNPRYKYCTICAHLLKKFYNFKQKCLKACKILKSVKGKPKVLPTNLHEQIPSSIGPCSSLAPYKLLEHQHHTDTDTDLLETKPDLSVEPNITPNNTEVNSNQNLETADSTLPVHIELKYEPMHDVLDPDIETMQEAVGKNIYNITTSNGYLTIDSNFEKQAKSIKSEANSKELNTNTNNNTSKDDVNQSKINDFLESFKEEIKEFENNSVDEDDMEVKDTTYMLNNDPLKDDESLNSMDDIESDSSDSDVESQPVDEQNSESDSDSDSLSDIIEQAKNKKVNIYEIYDLKLAEILLNVDRKNKVLKRRVQFLKDKRSIKEDILKWFENDEYDLGDGLKISKEVFLKIYEKWEKTSIFHVNHTFKDTSDKQKTDDFLRSLHKMYNPEYLTVFDIEYLDTEEKKLQEFNHRKDRAEYQNAPYKCARCYKGFQVERLHAYHMKKHDESHGAHECRICSLRFHSAARQRSHTSYCHSTVYVCRQCQRTFYYFASMVNHFNLHKGKEYPCSICNGIYRTYTGLATHKRSHATSHVCSTCAKSFVSEKGLLMHRRVKHNVMEQELPEAEAAAVPAAVPGSVRCDECDLSLDSQMVYKRHLRISHRSQRYVCNCLKRFSSMAELRQHKADEGHQHSVRIKAGTIGTLFKRRGSSGTNTETPATIEECPSKAAVRTCPVCQEEIPNNFPTSLYNHHTMNHPGVPYQVEDKIKVRNFLCDECGKRFVTHAVYRDHKNTHTGARPYVCPECNRAFATALNLWQHAAWHRPPTHKCKICGKLFNTKSGLCIHMRIHKNDRRYICDVCSASFIHAGSLTEHIRGVHRQQRRARKNKHS